MIRIVCAIFTAFFIGMFIAPVVIHFIKKMKARQTILCYVTQHKDKEGIPTMGGIIFVASALISSLIFWTGAKKLALICVLVTLSYFLIGFIDDFLKVVLKRNLGLRAYQKIISQATIAILATIFAYNNQYIGSEIVIPMFKVTINIGWWYIPLSFLVYIATTNAVNLTDGLDGLAGSTSSIYLSVIFVIVGIKYIEASNMGATFYAQELYNMLLYVASLVGGIMAFLWHNAFRAKIFMGDTGSLALGGSCAIVPMFVKNPLVILIAGAVFVLSALSVIMQVFYYKLKKKRIFLMAPFHHHLEKKGINESKIVTYYCIISAICGLLTIIIF